MACTFLWVAYTWKTPVRRSGSFAQGLIRTTSRAARGLAVLGGHSRQLGSFAQGLIRTTSRAARGLAVLGGHSRQLGSFAQGLIRTTSRAEFIRPFLRSLRPPR